MPLSDFPARLRCPDCGCRFTPPRADADRPRVPCPDCRAAVPNRDDLDAGYPDDRPRRGRPARRSAAGRWALVLLGVTGVLAVGCCGGVAGLFWWAVGPTTFPEQTQDYADARMGFKTTLVRPGPSPQEWHPEEPPDGAEEVTYTSGGLALKAWVDEPAAGNAKQPAVLFLHGGFAVGAPDWTQCQPFRDAGFVTMVPFLRGENGLPGSFTLFYDEIDDVLAAADVLAKRPGVDPNRVYVAGHSAGGTLAMLAAMTSGRFKGCASFSGSPDQVAFVRGEDDLTPFDPANELELRMRSPLAFPNSFKCPARLYWGDDEWLFKFSTPKLAAKATAAGRDVQAVEVPGNHTTAVAPAMTQAVTFFQQHK